MYVILLLTLLFVSFFLFGLPKQQQREEFYKSRRRLLPLWMPTIFQRSRDYHVEHPCLSGFKEQFPWVESTLDPQKPIHYHSDNTSVFRHFQPDDLSPTQVYAPKRLFD